MAKRGGGGENVGDFGFITLGVWYERIVTKRGGGCWRLSPTRAQNWGGGVSDPTLCIIRWCPPKRKYIARHLIIDSITLCSAANLCSPVK